MKRKILLIGGGGHCHSVIDTIFSLGIYDDIGIIDHEGQDCLGIPVIGTDADIPGLFTLGWTEAFITVGSIGKTLIRERLYNLAKKYGLSIPTIIDPTATIARGVSIQEGVFIGKRAVVNTGTKIGECAIINTGAITEHDCRIGDFAHVSPGAILCGQVNIGARSHIGAGTVVRQQISIGSEVLIGMGSVVVNDIPDQKKAYGNPCRVVE